MVEVRSRRGSVRGPARLGEIEPGSVFVPFHFGSADGRGDRRAANEMTITGWDPVSKQPHFKYAAVKVAKVVPGRASEDQQPAGEASPRSRRRDARKTPVEAGPGAGR